MHSKEEVEAIYDNFVLTLQNNFVFEAFVLGFSFSMIFLLILVHFIQQLPIPIMAIISLVFSLVFAYLPGDLSQLLNFIDIPISIIASFLYLRLCMSMSRSVMNASNFTESSRKQVIIIISFLSSCITAFMLYQNAIERDWLSKGIYTINVIILALTLFLNNGYISDSCLVNAYSITFFSKSEEYSTFISVCRFFFLFISFISLLKKFPIINESKFLIFTLKRHKVRILTMLAISSYLYISPRLMWQHGYERSVFQAISTPILYSLLLIYEYFSTEDSDFYGYT